MDSSEVANWPELRLWMSITQPSWEGVIAKRLSESLTDNRSQSLRCQITGGLIFCFQASS